MRPLVATLLAGLVTWGVLLGISKWVRLAPDWPLALVALGIAASVGLILWLYRYEQRAIAEGRARLLLGLRLAALAVLVWVVLEPTWVRTIEREIDREIVVVIDDSASMHLVDDGAEKSRLAQGEEALAGAELVETLSKDARVRTLRAARSVAAEGGEDDSWRQSTDLAAALDTVLDQVPPDELGGVVLVTDGRHNRPGRVEDVARRFGILDAPVGVLAVGSAEPPKDAAILSVAAPEAIHLGDRMRVKAELKFDGYKGKKATVRLLRADEVLDEREIPIPQDHHREELRFAQVPEGGVGDFRVEIVGLEGERFDDNNAWDFETSITDARTNVLLVDEHPRWEFRYLRNLFYGRDKSVHLQWALIHPDRIEGQEVEPVPASAARPFGEAQATALPENEDEWRKFDVIILGDLAPGVIDAETWEIIGRCVTERAAMLVMVAGPQHMPHAIASEEGRKLVPVEMKWGDHHHFDPDGEAFRPILTSAGSTHPVTQQSPGGVSNEQIWAEFPEMRWRHPLRELREGAEVLLTAAYEESSSMSGGADLETALENLAVRRQREAENALLVTRQTGRGKVALLLTDRTWRLREGSGDVYHHRFWGNLVRWGAGPVLRAGGERARLGTDQLTYTPDDTVVLRARLRDGSLDPVGEEALSAEIRRDGTLVETVRMTPVEGSAGFHEGRAGPFRDSGKYEVKLTGGRADELIVEDGSKELRAGFRVVGSRGPVELAETTLNLPLLETIADLSGGRVVGTDEVRGLTSLFLGGQESREEVREIPLWNHWLVLTLFFVLLTTEWILRRGSGLP
jgi:hypothetical protein